MFVLHLIVKIFSPHLVKNVLNYILIRLACPFRSPLLRDSLDSFERLLYIYTHIFWLYLGYFFNPALLFNLSTTL